MATCRKCISCGKEYTPRGPKQKYCVDCASWRKKNNPAMNPVDSTNDDAIITFIRSEMKKLHEKHESWIKMLHELGARVVELEKLVLPLNKMYNEEKLKRAKEAEEKRLENLKKAFEIRNEA